MPSDAAVPPTMRRLTAIAGAMACVYLAAGWVWLHPQAVGVARWPTLWMVAIYLIASLAWLAAIVTAVRLDLSDPAVRARLLRTILAAALCFRVIHLAIPPILELDVYRYMWDGIVSNAGVSPYRYSPAQVLANDTSVTDPTYRAVTAAAHRSPTHRAILARVHFPEYTTLYPPVSQLVFAAAMAIVPASASATTHLVVMKLTLTLFDIMTLWLVIRLVERLRLHPGWAVAYGWSPLVLKECANSGHLDSIAVFLTVAAAYSLVHAVSPGRPTGAPRAYRYVTACGVCLGLGVGAKLYPIVLAPLFLFVLAVQRGGRAALAFGLSFVLVVTISLTWLLVENDQVQRKLGFELGAPASMDRPSRNGLTGFLSHWRMNDVLFSFVMDNVRPNPARSNNLPWYVVIPDSTRVRIHRWIELRRWSPRPAFFVARFVTLALFAIVYGFLLFRLHRSAYGMDALMETLFLVLAVFFFLQPTENPWYWLWALPFVCFARNRAWLLVSCWLFVYYVRFWLKYSEVTLSVWGWTYEKAAIFDYGIAWIEHALILAGLVVGAGRVARADVEKRSNDRDDCPNSSRRGSCQTSLHPDRESP